MLLDALIQTLVPGELYDIKTPTGGFPWGPKKQKTIFVEFKKQHECDGLGEFQNCFIFYLIDSNEYLFLTYVDFERGFYTKKIT